MAFNHYDEVLVVCGEELGRQDGMPELAIPKLKFFSGMTIAQATKVRFRFCPLGQFSPNINIDQPLLISSFS